MTGGRKEFANYILYNFSGLKGQIKISRKGLHFYSSRVTLVFSASDKDFLDYLLSVLFEQKELLIGNLQLVPEAVENEDPGSIGDSVKFLCISPVVLLSASFHYESGKRFISPQRDEISDLLFDSTIVRMEIHRKVTPAGIA